MFTLLEQAEISRDKERYKERERKGEIQKRTNETL